MRLAVCMIWFLCCMALATKLSYLVGGSPPRAIWQNCIGSFGGILIWILGEYFVFRPLFKKNNRTHNTLF